MSETTEYTAPAVHVALAEILKSLSVEKGGTLPQNMGGRPYITAGDLFSEVKRQFVEHDLIFVPDEHVIEHTIIQHDSGRNTVAISVNGSYQIISTIDGSEITFGGVGDGLATGTAVASNIASTNALKNALLRTLLVSETAVEDAAKNGTDVDADRKTPAQQKIEAATKALDEAASVKQIKRWVSNGGEVDEATGAIAELPGGALTGANVTAIAKRLHGDGKEWQKDEVKSKQVANVILSGERK